jgi:hypothetical protein
MKRVFLMTSLALLPWTCMAAADGTVLPPDPPAASHYETLWTKSPFSVATPEEAADSPDYALVGVTQLDGVAYASIVQKQNSDHFLISSEKEIKGMLLKSVTHSTNGTDTFASVEKDGQILTLKLESTPLTPPTAPGTPPMGAAPGINVPPVAQNNIVMPGASQAPQPGTMSPAATRFMRIHRPAIHLPPMPNQGVPPPMPTGAPPTDPNAPQPGQVQPHNPPPSQ